MKIARTGKRKRESINKKVRVRTYMKKLVVGILAHVDAGKTTLSESILYRSGSIRELGRVDHKTAFLDTFPLERLRGITIFSKQAVFTLGDIEITLLDTPGHVDFSAEMERTLQVLDYAVLVINGAEGVQGHTETLWKLLSHYNIPVFLFVNKMDQAGTDPTEILADLKKYLDEGCTDFGKEQAGESMMENIAMCEESLLDQYLETGLVEKNEIIRLVKAREIFPCYFGSALKLTGIDDFLQGMQTYMECDAYPDEFGARIYKVSRDEQGNRLSHMKVTGGSLKVKTLLTNRPENTEDSQVSEKSAIWEEKINQIRIYSGTKYRTVNEAKAGTVCAVTGLTRTKPGEGLGIEAAPKLPLLEPVLTYRMILPKDCDVHNMLLKLRVLEEEEPQLHITWKHPSGISDGRGAGTKVWEHPSGITDVQKARTKVWKHPSGITDVQKARTKVWKVQQKEGPSGNLGRPKNVDNNEEAPSGHIGCPKNVDINKEAPSGYIGCPKNVDNNGEIYVQLMGEVQTEILKSIILERFGVSVAFSAGNILYKETISEPAEGVGHFEPLRHYAEVHLLLEPLEPGSGLVFDVSCSEDILGRNWQRLVLTHLKEKDHKGVLTGSSITDMKITLIAGRAHQKHTEGGDFREATYRALRQGLMKAKSILLEPYYEFRLEVPSEMVGRAMSDIQKRHGVFHSPEMEQGIAILTGSAPASELQNYQLEVQSYTSGRGRLFCTLKGYEACHNTEEVIDKIGYDAKADMDNPADSVFCSHGAGFLVSWDQVEHYMHVDSGLRFNNAKREQEEAIRKVPTAKSSDFWKEEKELEEIFQAAYGSGKRESGSYSRPVRADLPADLPSTKERKPKKQKNAEEYLLVDGYNIIFAWDELKELAKENIGAARDQLMDILCNYQGFVNCILILVFDAYNVDRHTEEVLQYKNIFVVYTKEAETADQYIEKTVHEIGRKHQVIVATSDGLEQMIISGEGGRLLSAKGLEKEIERVKEQIREEYMAKKETDRNYLFNHLSDEMAEHLEEVRLNKKDF